MFNNPMTSHLYPNAFMLHNGIHLVERGQDYAVTELEITENSYNPYGIVHGGAYYTMADCAAGHAARSDGRRYVTQGSNLHFLRSADSGTLRATARVYHRGRKTCLLKLEIRDETDELLVTGDFTFFCLDN
ncbi:MAG: PaaI family thioesterase [Oscillospiraceae bacterium]